MDNFLILGLSGFVCTLLLYLIRTRFNKRPQDMNILFVINSDLKMSDGKIISQIAHAMTNIFSVFYNNSAMYKNWVKCNKNVGIYKGCSLKIKEMCVEANQKGIRYSKIHDAGRTQIPSGSNTILIVGPAPKKEFDTFTLNLEAYQ